ncbi:hypothetical protein [Hyphococcus sp.]|uniref:hypothetical protein n=1 Tax=Hyphococcus sp. TaxID=2038636 RepID=UPI003CCBE3DF
MGWRLKAFSRGMLISVPIIAAILVFGVNRNNISDVFEAYDPLYWIGFFFLALWLGIANMLAIGFLRRRRDKEE